MSHQRKSTLLPVSAVADRFGRSSRTIREWIVHGLQPHGLRLPAVRVGREWRVSESDLYAFEQELARRAQ